MNECECRSQSGDNPQCPVHGLERSPTDSGVRAQGNLTPDTEGKGKGDRSSKERGLLEIFRGDVAAADRGLYADRVVLTAYYAKKLLAEIDAIIDQRNDLVVRVEELKEGRPAAETSGTRYLEALQMIVSMWQGNANDVDLTDDMMHVASEALTDGASEKTSSLLNAVGPEGCRAPGHNCYFPQCECPVPR